MKLLFLCKRRPMARDLLTRPYGRFYHLPRLLAARGHQVIILLLGHGWEAEETVVRDGMTIRSVGFFPGGPVRYLRIAERLTRDCRPDWIIGCSDTYYGILAQALAKRHGHRSLIDAYDNYESYLPWCLPLHLMWRRALAKATAVTAAGPQLADLLRLSRPGGGVAVVPMAADPEFVPADREECRLALGLPTDKRLVGYCGSLFANRGVELLFLLAERLSAQYDDVEFVVSGRCEPGLVIPKCIRQLGYLPDDLVPSLLGAVDLLLVLNRDSAFGRYSYPAKLYEAVSCQIPVVSSDTLPARWILGGDRRFLAGIDDFDDFADKVIDNLSLGRYRYPAGNQTWMEVVEGLEKILVDH